MQTTGVNGADVYTAAGVGDMRVAFYTSMLRDMTDVEIRQFVRETLDEGRRREKESEYIRDLWLMAFQARDVRGGKGERRIALELFAVLFEMYPQTGAKLATLIPEYGSWRDIFHLMLHYPNKQPLMEIVRAQFWKDREALAAKQSLSLLAKWLPREKSKTFKAIVPYIIGSLYPPRESDALGVRRLYRKHVSEMNRVLETTEVKMCGKTWATINPGQVPGKCLMKNRVAFYNQTKKNKNSRVARSTDPDRIKCAENFKGHMKKVETGEATIKGANVVYPHEVVREITKLVEWRVEFEECKAVRNNDHYDPEYWRCNDREESARLLAEKRQHLVDAEPAEDKAARLQRLQEIDDQLQLLEAQWKAIRKEFEGPMSLRRVLPICDFSGSMEGVPMAVSLALGILISELSSETFRNCIIPFSEKPKWIELAEGMKLREKIKQLMDDGSWNMNTNFEAAYRLVLDRMIERKTPVGEEPEDILVFTDMGFDDAVCYRVRCGHDDEPVEPVPKWATLVERFKEDFSKASEMVHGVDSPFQWTPPRLVIWNLRAEYKDYQARATEPGVLQLSGWSPSALKVLTSGINVQTPYEGFREIMDDERYTPIWKALQRSYT